MPCASSIFLKKCLTTVEQSDKFAVVPNTKECDMTRPHLKYRAEDFPAEVLKATELLFEAKPWRLDIGQLDLYQRWADVVCEEYGAGPVGIQKVDVNGIGFSYELGPIPNIIIGRYSLATLFCGMGMHINAVMGGLSSELAHIEWGYSLFYTVRPVMFRRRVREGRIVGMTAKDTFSRDTWDRLERLGLTVGDFMVDAQFDVRTLDADDDLVSPDEVAEAVDAEWDGTIPVEQEDGTIFNFPISPTHNLRAELMEHSITSLRRLSRGLVSGGYNMTKSDLVDALIAAGVTTP
jgi:hypothetical protein